MTETLETILGHAFQRPALLKEALTHRSAAHGHGQGKGRGSNERLEFIGDRVLGLSMAEWLAERFPREQEGELGRRLAYLVSQPVLASVAERIGLAAALSVSPGEAQGGCDAPGDGAGRRAGGSAWSTVPRWRAGSGTRFRPPRLARCHGRTGGTTEGRQDGFAGMGTEAGQGSAVLRSDRSIRPAA